MQQLLNFFNFCLMTWKEIISIFHFCIYHLCLFLHWHIDVQTTTTDIWGLPTRTNPCLHSFLCSICSKNTLEINLWGVHCVQWRIYGLFFKMSCFTYFVESLHHKGIKEILSHMDHTKSIFNSGEVLCKIIKRDLCTLWDLCQLRVVSHSWTSWNFTF